MRLPTDMDYPSWRKLLSQDNRFITLQTALPDEFLVERMDGHEAFNEDLDFNLDCVSMSAYLDIRLLIDRCVNLQLLLADGSLRLWQGLVTEAEQQGSNGGMELYRLRLGSWLSLLKQRRNTLIFKDLDALGIVAQVFADYPQAQWRHTVTQPLMPRAICTQYRETDYSYVCRVLSEEGLSFRFEHADTPLLDHDGLPNGSARLVIFDRNSAWPDGEDLPFTRINATQAGDGISRFSEAVEVCSDSAATSRWDPTMMRAAIGTAHHHSQDGPVLPTREIFDPEPPFAFATSTQADLHAQLLLGAARMRAHQYTGEGAIRQLQPGPRYTLRGLVEHKHPLFICLSVTHRAVNNLGIKAAQALRAPELEAGSYCNSFTAIPNTVRMVSTRIPRPLAAGVQSAMVVGQAKQAMTSTRDHQVRVQFGWQRGDQPQYGGLHNANSRGTPEGHAPGDERSGNWVRVAEDAAGNNFGQHFTPRIGAEVLVGFTNGDIDQPCIIGQLYGGNASPPFAAGVDAPTNHPGTVSGMATRNLDGTPSSQWLLDDASGQLRHELRNANADSHLALGYLVEQQRADRGAYLGEGFVESTDAWGQVRAEQGLLLSASRRTGATSTQMDMSEAYAQLLGAVDTAERLDQAVQQAQAGSLNANATQRDLADALDPAQGAHHPAQVNGQSTAQPKGEQRDGGNPVPTFKAPHMVLETPSHLTMTTPNSSAAYAGEHLHMTAQQDAQFTAGHSIAGVSGDSLQWFTASGGAKVIAQNGNVSLQANSDALEIIADQSLIFTATDEGIELVAKDKIVLQCGTSSITLQGAHITFSCEGAFRAQGGEHAILGGAMATVDKEKFALPIVGAAAIAASLAQANAERKPEQADGALEEELEEEEEEVELEQLITLRVGVFFDGTGNNRENSEMVQGCFARDVDLADAAEGIRSFCKQQGYEANGSAPDDSHGNDSSNVAKLYELYQNDSDKQLSDEETEAFIRIYLEGIGTSSTDGDSLYSGATGLGEQGVRARVEESPIVLLKTLRTFQQNNPEKRIQRIEFDVFGFSRGAAAARDFVNEVLKGPHSIIADALPVGSPVLADSFAWKPQKDFCINYIGIIDTVAAIADYLHGDFSGNNANNPDINIKLAPDSAKKIVHLVALDERRYNFALNKAGDADIVLPGVHSDLGGGYRPKVMERVLLSKPRYSEVPRNTPKHSTVSYEMTQMDLRALQKQYRKYGLALEVTLWQVDIDRRTRGDRYQAKEIHAAVISQREVFNDLALIYLRIMRELAVQHGVPFQEIPTTNKRLALPEELLIIADKLMAYALGKRDGYGLTPAEDNLLYRRYVHLSCHWNPANDYDSDLDVVFLSRPSDDGLRTEHPNE